MEKTKSLLRHCESIITSEDRRESIVLCEKDEKPDDHLYNGYGFDITKIDDFENRTADLKRPRLIMNKMGRAVIKVKMVNKSTKKEVIKYFHPLHKDINIVRSLSEKDMEKAIDGTEEISGFSHPVMDHDGVTDKLLYKMMVPYFKGIVYNDFPSIDDPCHNVKEKSVVGLLYSGGKDSTARLIELLEQGKSVLPIMNMFNKDCVSDRFNRCLSAIRNLRIINDHKYKGTLYRPIFPVSISFLFTDPSFGFCQQQTNILSLSMIGPKTLSKLESIEMCLIMGDQGISFINDLKRVYNSVMKFNVYTFIENKTLPTLRFPYSKMDKENIIDKLLSFGDICHEIYVPSCQRPRLSIAPLTISHNKCYLDIYMNNCGDCVDCKHLKNIHQFSEGTVFRVPLDEVKMTKKDEVFEDFDKTVLNEYLNDDQI